jgi:hypothetical protein
MTVVVRFAIVPPDWTTFAERDLGAIDRVVCRRFRRPIARSLCAADSAARVHELADEAFTKARIQRWIACPPQSPTHDEIAAIGRRRVLPLAHPLRSRPVRLRKVIDQRGCSIGAMLCSHWCRTSPDR